MEQVTEKEYTSVEDIDADLAEEFAKSLEETTPEVVKTEVTEVVATPETPKVEVVETAEVVAAEKETKDGHAFAKLRADVKQATLEKEKIQAKAAKQDEMFARLAKASGYESAEEYRQELENKLIEAEAKVQGIDPKAMKEISRRDAEIAQMKLEKAEEVKQENLTKFVKTIDKVVTETGLTKEDGEALIAQFDADGYTLEQLLSVPHYEYLIRGALSVKIASKATEAAAKVAQEVAKGIKVSSVDTAEIPATAITKRSLDEQLDLEMAAYAKERGIPFK